MTTSVFVIFYFPFVCTNTKTFADNIENDLDLLERILQERKQDREFNEEVNLLARLLSGSQRQKKCNTYGTCESDSECCVNEQMQCHPKYKICCYTFRNWCRPDQPPKVTEPSGKETEGSDQQNVRRSYYQ